MLDRFLTLVVGITCIAGGAYLCRGSMDAKNLIQSAIFGLLVIAVGLFLTYTAFAGPPG